MATVRDILVRKGSEVVSVGPTESVLQASRLMTGRSMGSVLVTEGRDVLGIVTEQDILRRVVAEGRDVRSTQVGEVMTTPVLTCSPEMNVDEVAAVMNEGHFRHLPVVDARGVCGVLSVRDVLALQVEEKHTEIEALSHYLYARSY